MDGYLAAAIQFDPLLGDKEANIAHLKRLVTSAAQKGAKLIVTPEMATTGYCWESRHEIAGLVEQVPGATSETFSQLARDHECWIAVGMPEVDVATGSFFNSAILVGPDGLCGHYRKTHSFVTEVRWAQDGNLGLPVFETEIGRVGLLICMDAEYPEPARVLAVHDCDVVCFPTNWLSDASPSAFWMTRAYENGAYWVASNRCGRERGIQFSGGSGIINPDGSIASVVRHDEGIAIAPIQLERARRTRRERLSRRDPARSRSLLLNTYLWPDSTCRPVSDDAALHGISTVKPAAAPPTTAILPRVPASVPLGAPAVRWMRHRLRGANARLLVVPLWAPAAVGCTRSWLEDQTGGSASSTAKGRTTARQEVVVALVEMARALGAAIATSLPVTPEYAAGEEIVFVAENGEETLLRTRDNGAPALVRRPWGTIGFLCATDLLTPEPIRSLATEGVDLVVSLGHIDDPQPLGSESRGSAADNASHREHPLDHWYLPRVRAAENNVWLAFANSGRLPSGIFGPLFYSMPRHETVMFEDAATLPPAAWKDPIVAAAVKEKPYLKMRRPHLYEALVHSRGSEGSA